MYFVLLYDASGLSLWCSKCVVYEDNYGALILQMEICHILTFKKWMMIMQNWTLIFNFKNGNEMELEWYMLECCCLLYTIDVEGWLLYYDAFYYDFIWLENFIDLWNFH